MRIALNSSADRNASFEEIASRFSSRFCDDATSAQALITNRVTDAIGAAGSGTHVLFDTPEILGAADCQSLAKASLESGVVVMPGNEWRFVPSVATVHSSLAAGKLGEPGLLRIHRWKTDSSEMCERSLLMADLDLAAWMFGQSPVSIYVARRPNYVQIHLGFEGGGMAIMDHSMGRPANTDYDSLSLIGSTGAAYADDHHNMNLVFGRSSPSAIRTDQGSTHLVGMLKEFLAAISESRPPSVTLADTERALKTVGTITNSEGRIL